LTHDHTLSTVFSSIIPGGYQLDFVTPGIMPSFASFLKQILHILNFRKYPRDLPQSGHLL